MEPGQVVNGNLVVERALGRGGMAMVVQVRDVTDGQRYALKVLTHGDATVRKRILQEGKLQAQLNHPHIIEMRGELRVAGQPALLMELARGPSLHRLLRGHKPELGEALAIFRGICMGIGTAHHQGMIHRDLKPANVLLSIEGGQVVPKVTDFGIARDVQMTDRLTQDGVSFGTPRFMAPEQLDNTATVDRRADIWSLGCILYQLVCGEPAFTGKGPTLLNQVHKAVYIPPSDHVPSLPDGVVFAIEEMLCRDVKKRLASVQAVFGVLDDGTALMLGTNLGELPVVAPKPYTRKPTTLPVEALPAGVVETLARHQLEDERFEQDGVSVPAPAPAPPPVLGGSLLPQTMTPEGIQRMRAEPGSSVPPGQEATQPVPSLRPPDSLGGVSETRSAPRLSPLPEPAAPLPSTRSESGPGMWIALGFGLGVLTSMVVALAALGLSTLL